MDHSDDSACDSANGQVPDDSSSSAEDEEHRAHRKRTSSSSTDEGEGESPMKRARGVERMEDALNYVARNRKSAAEVASTMGAETVDSITKASVAANILMSPFNPSCPGFTQFGNVFKYVLDYLPARETVRLRTQSRAVRDWVDQHGTISINQVLDVVIGNGVCPGNDSFHLACRFINKTHNQAAVFILLINVLFHARDPDLSVAIARYILDSMKLFLPRRSRFFSLWYFSHNPQSTSDTPFLTWQDIISGECDITPLLPTSDEEAAITMEISPIRHVHNSWRVPKLLTSIPIQGKFTTLEEKVTLCESSLMSIMNEFLRIANEPNNGYVLCRMSRELLHFIISERTVDIRPICDRRSFATNMIDCMGVLEANNHTVEWESGALEYALEIADAMQARPSNHGISSATIATTRVKAPLADILRIQTIKKNKSVGPLARAIRADNGIALRAIARRAMAQGISGKSQTRAIEAALKASKTECVRILCEERFVVSPRAAVKMLLDMEVGNGRYELYGALLADVDTYISRGRLQAMISAIDAHIDMKVDTKRNYPRCIILPVITCNTVAVCNAVDFLTALWHATSTDERARSFVVGVPEFRALVDRTLLGYIQCVLLEEIAGMDEDAVREMFSRISKLLCMQHRSDMYIDIDSGYFNPSDAPDGCVPTLTGVHFDRWLRGAVTSLAALSPSYMNAALCSVTDFGYIYRAVVADTDGMFSTVALTSLSKRLAGADTDVYGRHNTAGQKGLGYAISAYVGRRHGARQPQRHIAQILLRWCGILLMLLSKQRTKLGSTPDKSPFGFWIAQAINTASIKLESRNNLYERAEDLVLGGDDPKDDPTHTYINDMLVQTRHRLVRYLEDVHYEQPDAVASIYITHNGDKDAALEAEIEAMDTDGPALAEPTGRVRDIIVYLLASANTAQRATELINRLRDTVGKYTLCVTMPSMCAAITGSITQEHKITQWHRDLVRGRTQHAVWWGKGQP